MFSLIVVAKNITLTSPYDFVTIPVMLLKVGRSITIISANYTLPPPLPPPPS